MATPYVAGNRVVLVYFSISGGSTPLEMEVDALDYERLYDAVGESRIAVTDYRFNPASPRSVIVNGKVVTHVVVLS